MQTKVYKLYSAVSATTNAAASCIVQQSGVITSIVFTAHAAFAAALTEAEFELSFASTGQQTTNDTVGVLAQIMLNGTFTAAGTGQQSQTLAIENIQIPVNSGDRLYLNIRDPSSVATLCTVLIYVLQK